jgi:hypothetical protein
MKFAYADPPYPGQSKRWYENHPDYAGEVDHAELIGRLCRDYPDGWALSTSAAALQQVLALCPTDVRIAIWHVTNSEHPGNCRSTTRSTWWNSWEPVIVRGGSPGTTVRNLLAATNLSGKDNGRIAGEKPAAFCRWLFRLLGARPGDELDDLFPGSGAVGEHWRDYIAQPVLDEPPLSGWVKDRRNIARQVARDCDPLWT